MPCERKHIEAIEAAARKLMPGEPCHESQCEDCNDDRALLDAIHAALAACDESPCVWKSDGQYYRPACDATKGSAFMPGAYCYYCGRKIAPLPAAQEVGK